MGHRERQLPDPANERRRDAARRGGRPAERAGVLQRRLPLQRADADVQSPDAVTRPGLVARERAGARAHAPATSASSSPNVDFDKLAAQVNDDMPGQPGGVPRRADEPHPCEPFRDRAGRRLLDGTAVRLPTTRDAARARYRGRLQPYAIYVPQQPMPTDGYGLTLLLHSLAANYNQYLASTTSPSSANAARVDRDHSGGPRPRRLVLRLRRRRHVRGVGRRRRALPARPATGPPFAGYSMGGYGTYKFTDPVPGPVRQGAAHGRAAWPRHLGAARPTAPAARSSNTNRMLGSVRNIPFLIWNAAQDELVPVAGAQAAGADSSTRSATATSSTSFNPAEHLTLAINDEYGPAADFLGTTGSTATRRT